MINFDKIIKIKSIIEKIENNLNEDGKIIYLQYCKEYLEIITEGDVDSIDVKKK